MSGATPPEDIAGRRFTVAFRGYDRSEVDGFLRNLAREQAQLLRRVEDLEALLERIRSRGGADLDQELVAVVDDAISAVRRGRRTVQEGLDREIGEN